MDAIVAAKGKPTIVMDIFQAQLLVGTASFLANVMAMVALLRVVIFGDRKQGLPAWIWFGLTEARLVMVYLLLVIASIAAVIGTTILFAIFAALAAAVPGSALLVELLAAGLVVAAIWAAVKLSIVPAVVVAESTLGVERAWALMRGNAFRMFLISLLCGLPFAMVAIAASLAILGTDFPPFPNMTELAAQAKTPAAIEEVVNAWQVQLIAAMRLHWLEFTVLNFVSAVVGTALFAGIAGNAYLSLAGEPEHHA